MKTVMTKYLRLSKKAYKGRSEMDAACSEIYNMIKDMLAFEADDAHVFIQHGDGLVLCWDAHNTPVEHIIEEFEEKKTPLDKEDLLPLSI